VPSVTKLSAPRRFRHLREHNHGPRFYRLLDAQMPGWRAVKERLDGLAEQLLGT